MAFCGLSVEYKASLTSKKMSVGYGRDTMQAVAGWLFRSRRCEAHVRCRASHQSILYIKKIVQSATSRATVTYGNGMHEQPSTTARILSAAKTLRSSRWGYDYWHGPTEPAAACCACCNVLRYGLDERKKRLQH